MEGKRVLVIEDEPDIGELLLLHLRDLNVVAHLCADGLSGYTQVNQQPWDLVILDIRLPGLDGLEVCRRLRAEGNRVPILMLTAKSAELDRVLGLEIGADDYVTKPFSIVEVMARVRALLRRVSYEHRSEPSSTPLILGQLELDESRRCVKVAGQEVDLTAREFDLLLFFAKSPGQVFRRMQLLDQVWGFGHEGYEHTVNSHINRLRSKLHRIDDSQEYVLTVWGVGYKFNDQLESQHVA